MPIGGVQISARGLTDGEGKVREKVQELTAVTGVAGVGEEKDRGGGSMANRDGRRRSEGRRRRSGGRRVGEQRESSWEASSDDVVLVVCLAGAKRQ
jgi:hypothetical protein